jgi:hypothetical protein
VRRGLILLACSVLVLAGGPAAAATDDRYLEGYAAAVLERELGITPRSLAVRDAVVTVETADLAPADRDRVVAALRRIPGVRAVEVRTAAAVTAPAPEAAPARTTTAYQTGVLPGGLLFPALIADPRWPHFSAAYHYYVNDPDFGSVASVSLGETFALYRGRLGEGFWEAGVQAGVFAIFDLEASSFDLINADYLIAAVLAYRWRDVAAMGRFFHQSSHLGDEFLLRESRVDRLNLSFEAFDLRLSWEPHEVVRLYGGAAALVHNDPRSLDPWSVQYGLELRSPWPGPEAGFRPIAALDVQQREENGWDADISLRAGVQFEGVGVLSPRKLQLLLEYFSGHSPNGQFYRRTVDYLGIGLHFHF